MERNKKSLKPNAKKPRNGSSTKSLNDKHLPDLYEVGSSAVAAPKKSNFYFRVYELVEQIPLGKVTTYGAIAEVLGMKGSARMVGQALGALPPDSDVPAQRVINRIGALSGAHHFGGYDRMRAILKKEGVTFKAELVDMTTHFWDPASATDPRRADARKKSDRPKNARSKNFRKPL